MSKIEGDINQQMMQATPREELERQIMSSLVPKTEREHWACREIESLREQLGNLLALIHRDGGHYQANVGTDKAVIDAQKVLLDWRQSHDELAAMKEGK